MAKDPPWRDQQDSEPFEADRPRSRWLTLVVIGSITAILAGAAALLHFREPSPIPVTITEPTPGVTAEAAGFVSVMDPRPRVAKGGRRHAHAGNRPPADVPAPWQPRGGDTHANPPVTPTARPTAAPTEEPEEEIEGLVNVTMICFGEDSGPGSIRQFQAEPGGVLDHRCASSEGIKSQDRLIVFNRGAGAFTLEGVAVRDGAHTPPPTPTPNG